MKGSQLDTHINVVGYHLNRLDEPAFMAGPKPMRTEFGIDQRLESCEALYKLPSGKNSPRNARKCSLPSLSVPSSPFKVSFVVSPLSETWNH